MKKKNPLVTAGVIIFLLIMIFISFLLPNKNEKEKESYIINDPNNIARIKWLQYIKYKKDTT